MKKTNLLPILSIILLLSMGTSACSSSSNDTDNDKPQYKTEKNNDADDSSKEAEINADINKDLKLDKGWADGSLDEDGNPTDNVTPQEDFAWAIFIEKIEYSSGDLRIYVNNGFKNLNDKDRQTAI